MDGNMNKTLEQLVLIGYEAHRSELETLIRVRLDRDTNFVELFENYRSSHAKDLLEISGVSEDMLGNLVDGVKKDLALKILERQIDLGYGIKDKFDEQMKAEGLPTSAITNGMENSPWFNAFGSPTSLKGFSQSTNKLKECLAGFDEALKLINDIRENWNDVDPQKPLCPIDDWQDLFYYEVPEDIQIQITKHFGN